jgi:Fe2+ or Zn2+ uptake regulation protein
MKRGLAWNNKRKRILRYILDKGFDGASIREIWNEFCEVDYEVPAATVISVLDGLVDSGYLIEKRTESTQGYFRRFYDTRYMLNNNRS